MVKGIIFDVGGVLAYDIREYLFYEESTGLISKFGLDKKVVSEVDSVLYNKYAYNKIGTPNNWKEVEAQYWNEVIDQFKLQISVAELVAFSEKYIRQISQMTELIKSLKGNNFDLLICSNNTEFWYQRVQRQLELDKYFEEEKVILSNRFGASKSDPNFTLFKELEKKMDNTKEKYLFVDDRMGNIDKAIQFGLVSIFFPAEFRYGNEYIQRIIDQINQ